MHRLVQFAPMLGLAFLVARQATAAEPSVTSTDLPRLAATEPADALGTFQVRDGFTMQLAASEPLIADPIAMAFDESGRLFVVEMRDYSERREERLGRIRLLEDTDGDGVFDQSHVYLDHLPWPTAVICYQGGIFVGSTPDILFCKDTNGDNKADVVETVFTGFGNSVARLNVQQLLNTFTWGLDNRIHGATGGNWGTIRSPKNPSQKPLELRGHDFSFDPRTLDMRLETGGAQHGMSFDSRGRKFVCSNSAHIQTVMYDARYSGLNPYLALPHPVVDIPADGPAAEVFRLSPDERWRVIRTTWRVSGLVSGPIEGGGRPSGYFTGATGVTIYRGNAWPEGDRENAFIGDAGSNLIHRKQLHRDGLNVVARRPDDELKREFAASRDNWFRPVQFANAPDGTLYVADMYREVIEHPWSIPESIKKHLDLNSGNDRGRIYRIVPDGFKQPPLPRLNRATTVELVKILEHENGWHRDTAARLLYERQDRQAVPALEKLLKNTPSPFGRLHALHALNGLNAIEESHLAAALADRDWSVREHGIRILEQAGPRLAAASRLRLWTEAGALAGDPDAQVRYQLAWSLARVEHPKRAEWLFQIYQSAPADRWLRTAVLNSTGDDALTLFKKASEQPASARSDSQIEFLAQMTSLMAASQRADDGEEILSQIASQTDIQTQARLAAAFAEGHRRQGRSLRDLSPAVREKLAPIGQSLLAAIADPKATDQLKMNAVLFASEGPWEATSPAIRALLRPHQTEPVQRAAAAALARFQNPEAGAALIEAWQWMSPRLRSDVLNGLISNRDRTDSLLAAIRDGVISTADLSPSHIQALLSHPDQAARGRAEALLKNRAAPPRTEAMDAFKPSLALDGKAENGQKIFRERCFSCHRHGGEGFSVGPDLTSVQSSGKETLLSNIIDPSREINAKYLAYTIELDTGDAVTGLIANETPTTITLRRAFGDETAVPRATIKRIQSSGQSLMPEGLEEQLNPQDMADLLEFVLRGAPSNSQ